MINLIRSLSKKERKACNEFLNSSFFNRRPNIITLYDFIVKHLEFYEEAPTKQRAGQKVFGKKDFDDQAMRLLISDLMRLIEKFLIVQRFLNEDQAGQMHLVAEFRDRNLPKHFKRSYRKVSSALNKQKLRNADFWKGRYDLEFEQYQFDSLQRRTTEMNLQELIDTLDYNYMAEKLRQSCTVLSHQSVFSAEYDLGLLDAILRKVEAEPRYLGVPAIALYYYAYLMRSEPTNEAYFLKFKTLLFENGHLFPESEQRTLYVLALNYCAYRYNEGDRNYIHSSNEFYREGLKAKAFFLDGRLSRFTYRNIVTVGLTIKDYNWVAEFIEGYSEFLVPKYKESMLSFSKARLAYHQKNYEEALQLLQKSEYKDLLLNLSAKTVLIKIYYELGEEDLLESHLDAMRNFIRRKKGIGYHQENFLQLIYFVRKLLDRNPYDRESKAILKQQIEETKALAEKSWLLEQLG